MDLSSFQKFHCLNRLNVAANGPNVLSGRFRRANSAHALLPSPIFIKLSHSEWFIWNLGIGTSVRTSVQYEMIPLSGWIGSNCIYTWIYCIDYVCRLAKSVWAKFKLAVVHISIESFRIVQNHSESSRIGSEMKKVAIG